MSALLNDLDVSDVKSWDEVCVRFGRYLNLPGPAPSAVVRRAMEDNQYAFHLVQSRHHPKRIERLLQDRRNTAYEAAAAESEAAAPDAPSTTELVKRATTAMFKWAKSGFTQVAPAEFEQRWGACQRCPDLEAAPEKTIYKIVAVVSSDTRVCGRCGCVAHRKALLSTESCPGADPARPGFNRWGQPFPVASA